MFSSVGVKEPSCIEQKLLDQMSSMNKVLIYVFKTGVSLGADRKVAL